MKGTPPGLPPEEITEIPNLWTVKFQRDKETRYVLIVAPNERQAVSKFNRISKRHPELKWPRAFVRNIFPVAALK